MIEQKVKQVIVIRKDLKMRLGKSIAQGAHASLMAYQLHQEAMILGTTQAHLNRHNAFALWNDPINGYRKITLGCNSEEELLTIYKKAEEAGLIASLVRDLGLTEFKEKTYTCVAIGPHYDEEIDPITSGLSLL
jgi:peptidyl-tRNA hydrolase, PTH2 family